MDIYDFVLGCSDAISCDKFAGVNSKFLFRVFVQETSHYEAVYSTCGCVCLQNCSSAR